MQLLKKHYQHYFYQWAVGFLLILIITAAFNYLVDPYGFFDIERVKGFNQLKPAASSHVRIVKPYQLNRINPHAVIAGNSRPEMGINPDHECWPEPLKPVYNFGLPGADVYMVSRNLQHAVIANQIHFILWGLDFKDFLSEQNSSKHTSSWPPPWRQFEKRLNVNADETSNTTYWINVFQDYLKSLFSLDALEDSFYTISKQVDKRSSTVTRNGFNPARDMRDIIKLEGQGIIFKQKNIAVTELFSHPERSIDQTENYGSIEFTSMVKFFEFAKKHNVKVVLFINPYHADYLTAMELAGWWPQFESWKRKLTSLSASYNIELWDFSLINDFSTEQPPAIDDKKTLLQWFWEPAHYRKELGNLMLNRILHSSCESEQDETVGIRLTKTNIENHLESSRRAMADYKANNRNAIKRLQRSPESIN